MDPSDVDWLRSYVDAGDETALTRLIDRHAGWVSAAARRRLGGDDHLAEDATQVVFMLLASKASAIIASERDSVAAWLFHAMHLTCGRLRRSGRRRAGIELRASQRGGDETRARPDDQLRMLMEDAIAQLAPADRQAVVSHFYQKRDYQTVGDELGCSADAARKRVARALASVRNWMLRDGIDVIPDDLLAATPAASQHQERLLRKTEDAARLGALARGALTMMQQAEAADFTVWSAEFFVKDVEANLDFFEKLGFRRHFIDNPDAMGRIPRASLRGGKTARLWLRRATDTEGTRPTPGMTLYFWIDGGADALTAHRDAIAAQGVQPSAFFDDVGLRNFTVTSPDGYTVGFFTAYQ